MNIKDITPVAMIILVAVIAISIGATVLTNLRTTIDTTYGNTSPAYNITTQGLDAMATFGDFFPVIVIVAIASIVIGLVWYFGKSGQGSM
jgi:hypothetical protein